MASPTSFAWRNGKRGRKVPENAMYVEQRCERVPCCTKEEMASLSKVFGRKDRVNRAYVVLGVRWKVVGVRGLVVKR